MSWQMTGLVKTHFAGRPALKLLALILADYAHEDGGGIFPSVELLAQQTWQSDRTVQRQLRELMLKKFLEKEAEGGGTRWIEGERKGIVTRYRIAGAWIDLYSVKVSPYIPRRVTKRPPYPDTAVSPEYSEEPTEEQTPPNPPQGGKVEGDEPASRKSLTLKTWLQECEQRGEKPIPAGDPVFTYCDRVGIGRDILQLHWAEFKQRRGESRKRQADWRQTFRNSVRDNWFRLWYLPPGRPAELTSAGRQALAAREVEFEVKPNAESDSCAREMQG